MVVGRAYQKAILNYELLHSLRSKPDAELRPYSHTPFQFAILGEKKLIF